MGECWYEPHQEGPSKSSQVTLLEVLIQLEEPVEHPENFFFVEKCTVLEKPVKVLWADVYVAPDLYISMLTVSGYIWSVNFQTSVGGQLWDGGEQDARLW